MNYQTFKYVPVIGLLLASCSGNENSVEMEKKLSYPESKKDSVVDTYFGTEVVDAYRWLEDDNSEETKAWVKAQNEVSFSYLNGIQGKKALRDRLEELWNYGRSSAPRKVGEYYFSYRNNGLQNQSVIYRQRGLDGEAEVFIDPNELNEEGTTTMGVAGYSSDDRYMAVSRSEAGSDWTTLLVYDVETGKELSDKVEWVKFSGATWYQDGFFYSRYPVVEDGKVLSGLNENHMVYYHKVGTNQSEDVLVYSNPDEPNLYHWVSKTEDEKYLVLYVASGTDGFECHYRPMGVEGTFKSLFTGFTNKSTIIDHLDGRFLVHTDIDAPKYRLVSIQPDSHSKDLWKEVVSEGENLLEGVNSAGGKLFLNYLQDACNSYEICNTDGSDRKVIELPGAGSAGGFGGKKENKQVFYTYTSFNYPTTVFSYDIETGESKEYFRPKLEFDPEGFVSKKVKYKSKDGTNVNLFIVHKKGLEMNGDNPTLLYGYGGFNISLSPSFSVSNIAFMERGGVYAVANLRGGGEYGEEWHQDGMLLKKQNVFDDFISAAEYLIAEKYTSSAKLAIEGRSNGGLLVGACMTQKPDLFAVAFPGVGVMDMLRYHRFTVGWGWIPEYGCADSSKVHFDNLHGFSPLHNLKEGVAYPATMITTADHDDRVVPAHSFKFAARLQECHSGSEPVIIRIDVDAGHGAGKPTAMVLDEIADKWAFLFDNVGASL